MYHMDGHTHISYITFLNSIYRKRVANFMTFNRWKISHACVRSITHEMPRSLDQNELMPIKIRYYSIDRSVPLCPSLLLFSMHFSICTTVNFIIHKPLSSHVHFICIQTKRYHFYHFKARTNG